MQNHRFIFYLILLFVCVVIVRYTAAQSPGELEALYENQRLPVLKQYYDNNQITNPAWRKFVGALFETNTDIALQTFAEVHGGSKDKNLQKYALERVAEYYYARGYYRTAEKLLSDRKYANQIMSEHLRKQLDNPGGRNDTAPQESGGSNSIPDGATGNKYGIQVGAYSNYQNAFKIQNELLKSLKNVTILPKESDDKKLYIVVIGEYSTREQAERELQLIKQRNRINGFIIQY